MAAIPDLTPDQIEARLDALRHNWIELQPYGQRWYIAEPGMNMPLDIQATAMAIRYTLIREPRFCGQTTFMWSVAAHSLLLLDYVRQEHSDMAESHDVCLGILLHDASEFVLKDVASPLKAVLGELYKELQRRTQEVINTGFGVNLSPEEADLISVCDKEILLAEAAVLLPSKGLDWEFAKKHKPASLAGVKMKIAEYSDDAINRAYKYELERYI